MCTIYYPKPVEYESAILFTVVEDVLGNKRK